MIWNTSELSALHLSPAIAYYVVDCCQFGPSWIFFSEDGAYGLCRLGWRYNKLKLSLSWSYMRVSMIWNTPELCASHLSRVTAIFVVACCQFGPNRIFGLKMEFMACAYLVCSTTEQSCFFLLILYESINNMKHLWTVCIIPQPCHSYFFCLWLPIWP